MSTATLASRGLLAVLAVSALAGADEELPDEAFLEYLGSWDETDEDWQLLLDEAAEEDEKGESDPGETRGDDEPESNDE